MSASRRFVKRALLTGVTAVSVYIVIPSIVEVFSSWPELERLRSGSLLTMAVLILLSLGSFWALLGLCVDTKSWGLVAMSQLAASALSRILPGGAATATAVQYRLLTDGGVSTNAVATGMVVAGLLNFAVLFSLPIFAVPALLFGPPIAPLLFRAALAGIVGFVAMGVIGGVFLLRDQPLTLLGRAADASARRIRRFDPSAPPRSERFLEYRDLIRSNLGAKWRWVVVASLGKWGFEYFALVMAVRGVGHEDLSSILLLAFVTASLLSSIPFTPGGLGFVEAGLTGTLVLAGLGAGDAVLATLAYRLVSYWLPIPFGALAYGIHRRRLHLRGVEVESFPDLGERELDHRTGLGDAV